MFRRIRFSFSVQLLLLHLKRNHFLVLGWFILFCFVYFLIGERYGIPLLFLDPEYLGHVSFLSYFILGVAFGAYFMVWNVTSYILHARHFPFLATLQRPFGVYSLNNSLIPLAFLIAYLVQLLIFQRQDGLQIGALLPCVLSDCYVVSSCSSASAWPISSAPTRMYFSSSGWIQLNMICRIFHLKEKPGKWPASRTVFT